jgi:hypothetical protein
LTNEEEPRRVPAPLEIRRGRRVLRPVVGRRPQGLSKATLARPNTARPLSSGSSGRSWEVDLPADVNQRTRRMPGGRPCRPRSTRGQASAAGARLDDGDRCRRAEGGRLCGTSAPSGARRERDGSRTSQIGASIPADVPCGGKAEPHELARHGGDFAHSTSRAISRPTQSR